MSRTGIGTKYRSPEWKARISRGVRRSLEERRRRALFVPADMRALEAGHPVREELRPLAQEAAHELVALVDHVGGERASIVALALAQSAARLGIAERGLALRYAQTGDPEIASRLATVAGQRRSTLTALGVRRIDEPLDVSEYARAAREAARSSAGTTIDVETYTDDAPSGDRRSQHDLGSSSAPLDSPPARGAARDDVAPGAAAPSPTGGRDEC